MHGCRLHCTLIPFCITILADIRPENVVCVLVTCMIFFWTRARIYYRWARWIWRTCARRLSSLSWTGSSQGHRSKSQREIQWPFMSSTSHLTN
jgi:hypothetical protein